MLSIHPLVDTTLDVVGDQGGVAYGIYGESSRKTSAGVAAWCLSRARHGVLLLEAWRAHLGMYQVRAVLALVGVGGPPFHRR